MKKMPREKSKKQKKKDPELVNGNGMTRRTALKLGTAAGAVTMLTSRKSLASGTLFQSVPPEPTVCSPQPTHSPATTPFVQALPIPPVLAQTTLNPAPMLSANLAAGEAPRADHQRWQEFLPQQTYEMTLKPALHTFHPDLGQTYVWGYNGIYPGPTIRNRYGIPVVVRFHNDLPVDHTGFGSNTHTTHLHNGHTASESDGFAGDFWGPGFF
ncbi:MAG TPA: multicopper oxidase domain-containing protein, partial [Candidatus Sulfotelmatobacter sp.]|nr:multicopper oxidase domain-containing protein [Candidatus Sulfotelmatobacter sp.]